MLQLFTCKLIVLVLIVKSFGQEKPNIVIILADDLGWNDVGFHGSNQIPTPNIDSLAYNGITLNSHYVPALCTPSRASLMTGKYPTSIGMQHLVILEPEPWGLPLSETLMPQYLRRHGYKTHAIGKWHLGYCRKEYTPTYRGFDSHFGYWNGYQDYYDHTTMATIEPFKGYDMRRNMEVDYASEGKYSTELFTDEAVDIINHHNQTQGPLFLYLSHLAPHAGNEDRPYQAPDSEISKFSYISDPERRVYAAMVSLLDASVGAVMIALRNNNMLDNSIVLFLSDNGAVTFGVHSNHGSNYPLRGLKESPWEGGVRGVAALWSPKLNKTQRVSNQMMHMSDWLPTLYTAAGLDTKELGNIDGIDMWDALSLDQPSPRTEILHNIDDIEGYSVFTMGDWKLMIGTAQLGDVDQWYGESGRLSSDGKYNIDRVLHSETSTAINGYLTEQQLRQYLISEKTTPNLLNSSKILELRRAAEVECRIPEVFSTDNNDSLWMNTIMQILENDEETELHTSLPSYIQLSTHSEKIAVNSSEAKTIFECDPLHKPCLVNLKKDPCERLNLATFFPDILIILETRLNQLKKYVVMPLNKPTDPFSNPAFHNNVWTNWIDSNMSKPEQEGLHLNSVKIVIELLLGQVSLGINHTIHFLIHLMFSITSMLVLIFVILLVIIFINLYQKTEIEKYLIDNNNMDVTSTFNDLTSSRSIQGK